MSKRTWYLVGLMLLALILLAPLSAMGRSESVQAALPLSPPSAVHGGNTDQVIPQTTVYTWTQTTRADWDQGWPDWLDGSTISGTLQLMQRQFEEGTTISPRSELGFEQSYPAVAVDGSGNLYAVWEDWRDNRQDIYFAYRAAVSTTWSPSVRVNDVPGTAGYPALAADANSNVYVIWQDSRNESVDIYFDYRPAGGSWGADVLPLDDPTASDQFSPDIAVDGAGNAYAVWGDTRNGSQDIYFAYRPWGGSWGSNLRVDDDANNMPQSSAAIAVHESGDAYAAWTDHREGNHDIYFSFRPAGGAWGTNVKVSDDTSGARQSFPDIAVDGSGNAYAVWVDTRLESWGDIYASYRPAGGVWAPNSQVDDGGAGIRQSNPAVAADANGNSYAVWQDGRDDAIYSSYHPAGGSWEANIQVDDTLWVVRDHPAIAMTPGGDTYAMWQDSRNGTPDIYASVHPAGGSWETNVRVDDDPGGRASQITPDLAVDGSGNAYAVWTDTRNGDADIYFSYRAAASSTWGINVRVNDDISTYPWAQYKPTVSVDDAGSAYAIWYDQRDESIGAGIYFSYRTALSATWSPNERISSPAPPGSAYQYSSPAIAVDPAGNVHALWVDTRAISPSVYAAYRPAGGSWEPSELVSSSQTALQYGYRSTSIAVDAMGNAYALWVDQRASDNDIYFAYRPAGGSWNSEARVNDDGGSASQSNPDIAVDASGNAYAVWQDDREGRDNIYFSFRPVAGGWGPNARVNNELGHFGAYNGPCCPNIAVDTEGTAHAVWSSYLGTFYASRPAGGEWTASSKVATGYGPALALDPDGAPYVAWYWYNVDPDIHNSEVTHVYTARALAQPEYAEEGVLVSAWLDTGVNGAIWDSISWQGLTPPATLLTLETCSRSSHEWTMRWFPSDGPISSPPGQYFIFRATLATALTDVTPLLEQVQVVYHTPGGPSGPQFAVPCGVSNQNAPLLSGSAAAGSIVHLYVDGGEAATTTAGADGTFGFNVVLVDGEHTITATAENEAGTGPASAPLTLRIDPALAYDPLGVRVGQWSKDGWLLSPPRDAAGCADPTGNWEAWPRSNEPFRVKVPVSYTISATVVVTAGLDTITLTEETTGTFVGIFQPPLAAGPFTIHITADGESTVIGGQSLVDHDGVVYEAAGTISDTITGVLVTLYYSDTHSGQWLLWNARSYDQQVNPQLTLGDGFYSFYVPPGVYRVTAEKEGYPLYVSPALAAVSAPLRHNIPLGKEAFHIFLPFLSRNW